MRDILLIRIHVHARETIEAREQWKWVAGHFHRSLNNKKNSRKRDRDANTFAVVHGHKSRRKPARISFGPAIKSFTRISSFLRRVRLNGHVGHFLPVLCIASSLRAGTIEEIEKGVQFTPCCTLRSKQKKTTKKSLRGEVLTHVMVENPSKEAEAAGKVNGNDWFRCRFTMHGKAGPGEMS